MAEHISSTAVHDTVPGKYVQRESWWTRFVEEAEAEAEHISSTALTAARVDERRKMWVDERPLTMGRSAVLEESARSLDRQDQALKCPRCESTNTKFCYYNNYSLSQPRYFCKACRRYWTQGSSSSSSASSLPASSSSSIKMNSQHLVPGQPMVPVSMDFPNVLPTFMSTGFELPRDYDENTWSNPIPKHIKDAVAATFTNERMKIVGGRLAAFGHSPNAPGGNRAPNPGGVAGSGRRVLADSGGSIHAVGDYRLLRGVRLFTTPHWVTLPDDTMLRIVGIGRIEWEGFRVPNVYLVEGFQKILISISQLDRDHGMVSCFGKGKCEIMLADGITVAGGAILEDDGMYVLRFLEVPEPAQE